MYGLKDRVKVVGTIGPASCEQAQINNLLLAGLDVFRLNLSHGTHAWHKANLDKINSAKNSIESNAAVLFDLQGPKVRINKFINPDGEFFLVGDVVRLEFSDTAVCTRDTLYIASEFSVFSNVNLGNTLLLDDGKFALEVTEKGADSFTCRVIVAGQLTSNKGINLFNGGLNLPTITEKDRADLLFLQDLEFDFIALSFVRSANDIKDLQNLISNFKHKPKILAKFETSDAITNYEAIIEAADGIMVARGDLAIEVGAQKVPWLQKKLVRTACIHKKPAIVATQMMESMITASQPTRAEVSDVANAILDGADAVMLSGETAVGVNPGNVIKQVVNICCEANMHSMHHQTANIKFTSVQQVIAMSAVEASHKMNVDFLVALTETGDTALLFSKFGIKIPILGLSRHKSALSRMSLYKNVTPIYFDVLAHKSDIIQIVVRTLMENAVVTKGDKIIITKGGALGVVGETNSMVILEV